MAEAVSSPVRSAPVLPCFLFHQLEIAGLPRLVELKFWSMMSLG
jgi:hypothetical protein